MESHNYFVRKVDEMQTIVDELRAFFQGVEVVSQVDNPIHAQQITFTFDESDKSYLVPNGMDSDFFIDELLNKLQNGEMESVHEKEDALEIMKALKEGNIIKRKDGRYMGRIYVDGKQKAVYAPTKALCIDKVIEAIKQRDAAQKEAIVTRKNKMREWMALWLETYVLPTKGVSYIRTVKSFLHKHFENSKIADKEIGKLTPLDAQKFINSIEAVSVRAYVFTMMNTAMRTLKRNQVIKDNVFERIDKPKRDIIKKHVPNNDELSRWLEVVKKHWLYHVSAFISTTGLRIGEVMALTHKDIDMQKRLIHVSKSFNSISKVVGKPKTRTSTRDVPLSKKTIEIIEAFPINKDDLRLFWFVPKPHESSKLFNDWAKRYNFPRLTLHGLRHYFATKCFESGIPAKVVQSWLGHADYRITMDTYTHLTDDYEGIEAIKLDTLFDF
jgi:integrase